MNIFASVLTYELGKALGIDDARAEFLRQVADPTHTDHLPASRMVARLRELGEVMLCHPAGTSLPKVRSRAAHEARKWLSAQGGGVWVMVDDDVECDAPTLRRMLAAAGDSRVSVLPCPLRGTAAERHLLNVVWESTLLLEEQSALAGKLLVRLVRRGGCGLMVVPLEALEVVTLLHERFLTWHDDDDVDKVALFQTIFPTLEGHTRWLGEDYSFCERLREAGIPIVAPVEGVAIHDGFAIDLKLCQR